MIEIEMPVRCNLSQTSLQDAAFRTMGVSNYIVRCHPSNMVNARRIFMEQAKTCESNPLAPMISFIADEHMMRDAWSLETSTHKVWTEGC